MSRQQPRIFENQQQQRQQQAAVPGRPRRDALRMSRFNERKWEAQGANWADATDLEAKRDSALSREVPDSRIARNKQRAQQWREKKTNTFSTSQFKAETETPESGMRYNIGDIYGSTPIRQTYGMNADLSTFPMLCRRVYEDMKVIDNRMPRRLPFCAFLHHCTVALVAHTIRVVQEENKEGRILGEGLASTILGNIDVPLPIAEFLSSLTTTSTANGDTVAINIPEIAVPQVDTTNPGVTGTFGEVTPETHNVYECYVCPRTTRRRIEAVINRAANWTPLPIMPNGLVPTENFLGYEPEVELVNPEGREMLNGIRFPDDDTNYGVESRTQFSSELAARVNAVLRSISDRYKIENSYVPLKMQPGMVGFLEVTNPVASVRPLVDVSAHIWSPMAFGATLAHMTYFMGQRRKRTQIAPGSCFLTAGGEDPAGWVATRNSNFESFGRYAITYGVDDPALRTPKASALSAIGARSVFIDRVLATQARR